MTSSARDRAIEAASNRLGKLFDQVDEQTRRPGEPPLREAAAAQARARLAELAGEVPAPAGDAPPMWWSPQFGPIEESKDRHTAARYIGFSRQSFTWANLAELPADAVPLVPAGGSAPADDLERMRQERDDWRSVAESYRRSLSKMSRAGGSAPHQGATEPGVLWMAMRYALGRSTYAVAEVADAIERHAPELPAASRERMAREIQETRVLDASIDGEDWRRAVRALLGAATTTTPEA